MLTVGLDTHLKTSTCHILDENGKAVKGASRTIKGPATKMLEHLRSLDQPMRVCYEASCGYGVLHDQLTTFAQRVVVAHPGDLRLIFRSKQKNDRVDAQKLAMLLYLDQVPQVHVPGQDVRAWRELIEFRRRQVDGRTRTKNGLRALLRSYGIVVPREVGGARSLWTKAGLAWLKTLTWPTPMAALRRDVLLNQLQQAEATVKKLTEELDKLAAQHPGVTLLRTIPGIGPRTAEAVVAYVDDPHRFARVKRASAYFGLVPSQDASGGTNRLGHITKRGPATARKLLIEASWRCVDKCEPMREMFERIAGGKKDRRKIALVAVAHKLVRIMLAMLKSGETWDPTRLATNVFTTEARIIPPTGTVTLANASPPAHRKRAA